MLYKINHNKDYLILLPAIIRDKLIIEIHEMYGHIGSRKLYKLMNEDFTTKNLRHRIEQILSCCDTCQRDKIYTRPFTAPRQTILPNTPQELLSIEFFWTSTKK